MPPDFGNATVFSQTDSSNTTATDPGFPDGLAGSRAKTAMRALQGAAKRFRDHRSYTVTSAGTSSVQTLTYSVTPDLQTNDIFCFIAGFACPGAHTLNVNAIGAKSVKKMVSGASADPASGDWASGDHLMCRYDGTNIVVLQVGAITAGATVGSATINMTSKAINEAKGASVASASTADIWTPADGNFVHITGTTTITSLGTAPQAGAERTVVFDGALTLTYNATTLILPSAANITTAAGDTMVVRADTTANMKVISYTKADGTSIVGAGPAKSLTNATTSGTTVDVTLSGTPSRIIVALNGVSGSSTGDLFIRLGTGGGIISTGYASSAQRTTTAATTGVATVTTGFQLTNVTVAAGLYSGTIILQHIGGNVWTQSGTIGYPAGSIATVEFHPSFGNVSLGAQVTTVRLAIGSGNFDAGSFSVTWDQ